MGTAREETDRDREGGSVRQRERERKETERLLEKPCDFNSFIQSLPHVPGAKATLADFAGNTNQKAAHKAGRR